MTQLIRIHASFRNLRAGTFLSLLLLLAGHLPARGQTVYGPSGLFVHPSAYTSDRGAFGLNVSYFKQFLGNGIHADWLPVIATYGVTRKLEVGGIYVDRRFGKFDRGSQGAFAQYQLVPDSSTGPAVALVGSFIAGDLRQTTISAVASHTFGAGSKPGITLSGGLEWARRGDIPRPADAAGLFAGIEVPVGGGFRLVGEDGTRLSFDAAPASSFGAMWSGNGSMRLGVAFVNTGRSHTDGFFVGAGYTFGGSK
ncbi:MAG TPA: hypothetical protein VGS41_04650 [Chthonomonadales bacterium]|nr:hypothetical protein [Chthonomonadales bacterium]